MKTTKITIEIEHEDEMPVAGIYDIFWQLEWGYHTHLADLDEISHFGQEDYENWTLHAQLMPEDGYFWCENATIAAYEMARLSRLEYPTEKNCGLDNWFEYMHNNTAYGAACDNVDKLFDRLEKYSWWIDREFEEVSRQYLDTNGSKLLYCETFKPECDGDPDCYGYVIKCDCN